MPRPSGFLLKTALLAVAIQMSPIAVHAADTIVLGRSLVLSGPLKGSGEAKRDGADAYIQKINKAGGIGGRMIEVVTLDDEYTPANTVANLKKLAAENRLTAFLGLFGLPTVAAALPVLAQLQIPAVGLSSGSDALRTPFNRYVFPVRASFSDEARKIAQHVKTIGISKINVVHTDNFFGENVKTIMLDALKGEGLDAGVIKLDSAGKGASDAARLARAGEPQAIALAMLPQAAVPFLTELKKTSFNSPLYALSPTDASAMTAQLGTQAAGLAITQVVPIPRGLRVKIVAEYIQALTDLGHGTPSFFGLEGFIEAKILVEGLKRAGRSPSPESLVKALETIRDFDIGGVSVTYTPEVHIGSTFVEVDVINSLGVLVR